MVRLFIPCSCRVPSTHGPPAAWLEGKHGLTAVCDARSDEHGITPSGSYEVRLRYEAAPHTLCTAAWWLGVMSSRRLAASLEKPVQDQQQLQPVFS